MPSYVYARKARRDDIVRNKLVNLLEDLDAAQALLVSGSGDAARLMARDRVACFGSDYSSGIRHLSVQVNELGRIELDLDYADDLGEMRITYAAKAR